MTKYGPMGPLDRLHAASRVGLVLFGGSARCSFQVGVLETLAELGVRPGLCIAVSAGSNFCTSALQLCQVASERRKNVARGRSDEGAETPGEESPFLPQPR